LLDNKTVIEVKMKYLVLILALLIPINSHACSEVGASVNTLYKQSSMVFLGEVIDIQPLDNRIREGYISTKPTMVVLRPIEIFKADNRKGSSVHMYSDIFVLRGSTNCRPHFKKGTTYLVAGISLGVLGADLIKSSQRGVLEKSKATEAIEKLRILKLAHKELDKAYDKTKAQ
jgi:hypothetical protein